MELRIQQPMHPLYPQATMEDSSLYEHLLCLVSPDLQAKRRQSPFNVENVVKVFLRNLAMLSISSSTAPTKYKGHSPVNFVPKDIHHCPL